MQPSGSFHDDQAFFFGSHAAGADVMQLRYPTALDLPAQQPGDGFCGQGSLASGGHDSQAGDSAGGHEACEDGFAGGSVDSHGGYAVGERFADCRGYGGAGISMARSQALTAAAAAAPPQLAVGSVASKDEGRRVSINRKVFRRLRRHTPGVPGTEASGIRRAASAASGSANGSAGNGVVRRRASGRAASAASGGGGSGGGGSRNRDFTPRGLTAGSVGGTCSSLSPGDARVDYSRADRPWEAFAQPMEQDSFSGDSGENGENGEHAEYDDDRAAWRDDLDEVVEPYLDQRCHGRPQSAPATRQPDIEPWGASPVRAFSGACVDASVAAAQAAWPRGPAAYAAGLVASPSAAFALPGGSYAPSPKGRASRSDPVSRGAQMRKAWGQDRFLCNTGARKFDLRGCGSPAGQAPSRRGGSLLIPNYVPPHEKRRDSLRQQVRSNLLVPGLASP
eukprot:TRINITY_DN45431_c0_g1_i1.p1 TRINITY_DN45431_c0_g1~~TRINITY_DN45431_c0_g1_i1.p1  ORF type:complete len:481 (-),score=62.35 TRINITY_DN45431_c0_g1_i1:81-1430(-)